MGKGFFKELTLDAYIKAAKEAERDGVPLNGVTLKSLSAEAITQALASHNGFEILHFLSDAAITQKLVDLLDFLAPGALENYLTAEIPDSISLVKACAVMETNGYLYMNLPVSKRLNTEVQLAAIRGSVKHPMGVKPILTRLQDVTCTLDEAHILAALQTERSLLDTIPFLTRGNCTDAVKHTLLQRIREYDESVSLFSDSTPYTTDAGREYFQTLYQRIWENISDGILRRVLVTALLNAFPAPIGVAKCIPIPEQSFVNACKKDSRLLRLVPARLGDNETILKAAIPNAEERALVQTQILSLQSMGEKNINPADICEEFGIELSKPTKI